MSGHGRMLVLLAGKALPAILAILATLAAFTVKNPIFQRPVVVRQPNRAVHAVDCKPETRDQRP